jgi:hypothetical protein
MPLCRLSAVAVALITFCGLATTPDVVSTSANAAPRSNAAHHQKSPILSHLRRASPALHTRAPARQQDHATAAVATRAPARAELPSSLFAATAIEASSPRPAAVDPPAPTPRVALPAPAPPASPDPGGAGVARAQAILNADVPAAWLAAIAPRVTAAPGTTSWGRTDGELQFGTSHLAGDWQHLRVVVTHEFGHLIAYRYGSQQFLGAAPTGFPPTASRPEELWADCIARALTGNIDPSHNLAPCDGAALNFAEAFLAAGPSAQPRTG